VQDVHLGATYRLKSVQWSYIDREHKENWWGFFGQDALKIGKSFQFIASGRVDYVPYFDQLIPSPRGSAIFKPTERSAIRLSGATAFRAPSIIESYLSLSLRAPAAPGAGFAATSARQDQGGDFRLSREKVVSVDVGYLNQDFDFVNFEVAAYYLQVKDLIQLAESRAETVATNQLNGLNPQTGFFNGAYAGWVNQCLVYNTVGGEAGARVFPVDGVDVFANYSLSSQNTTRPAGCTDVENKQTPMHKVNLGAQVRSKPGIDGEVTFHYVSGATWSEQQPPPATDLSPNLRVITTPLSAYYLLNARIGYRFLKNNAEASATAFNLLNNQHQEHPFGQTVGRRFMGFFSYKF
jgi:iron complex outermembrane receptor protein